MTRTRGGTWTLTALAVALYLLLNWAFADGLLTTFWDSADWTASAIFTYLGIALIIGAGYLQANRVDANAAPVAAAAPVTPVDGQTHDPKTWQMLMGNVHLALFWLPIRLFVGREWFSAGYHKVTDEAWMDGGAALKGYWERSVAIPEGGRPAITYGWYRDVLQYMLDNEWYTWFGKVVAIGELLIGIGLLVGALVGLAAFFGTALNASFMLAGTTSSNPVLFGLSVFIVLAWKVAGYWGLDRWLLPALGAPWQAGTLFQTRTDDVAPHAPPHTGQTT